MTREFLKQDLERYAEYWQCPQDPAYLRYRDFVCRTEHCCERTHLEGHCTGSAFVVNPEADKVLLLYHPFLQRWLQPGGHADGSFDLQDVARREAHEESGLRMEALQPVCLDGQHRIPFDLDIHSIPERASKGEPPHFHFDLRYLFLADPGLQLTPESDDMRVEWLSLDEVSQRTDEESVLRMVRKLESLRPLKASPTS